MIEKAVEEQGVVFVVDDDAAVRDALCNLIRSIGLRAQSFESALEFMRVQQPSTDPSCLLLDVRMPGISGLDFQTELHRLGQSIPIIFMTGYGDIPMTVKAMKGGAIEFLTKPFRNQDVLDAIQTALEISRKNSKQEESLAKIRACFGVLTNREREVIQLVASGLMNKQIAGQLGVSEITVKVHRGNIMRKMEAKSLAHLVRMVDALALPAPPLR